MQPMIRIRNVFMFFMLGSGACLAFPSSSSAVVVAGNNDESTNPAANKVAPADALGDPGWANIGWRGFGTDVGAGATAIYLGNKYVLTAGHVGAGTTFFGTDDPSGGTQFDVDPNFSPVSFTNPAAIGGTADLTLYRLLNDPGLPTLAINGTSPATSNLVRMIGTGRERGSATLSATSLPPSGGYNWGPRDKAWGDNGVSAVAANIDHSEVFETTFQPVIGAFQATDKDSGSGAWVNIGGAWYLAGVAVVIGAQSDGNAEFGDVTGFVDLSFYKSQIEQYIPEPSAALMLLPCLAVLALRRKARPVMAST